MAIAPHVVPARVNLAANDIPVGSKNHKIQKCEVASVVEEDGVNSGGYQISTFGFGVAWRMPRGATGLTLGAD